MGHCIRGKHDILLRTYSYFNTCDLATTIDVSAAFHTSLVPTHSISASAKYVRSFMDSQRMIRIPSNHPSSILPSSPRPNESKHSCKPVSGLHRGDWAKHLPEGEAELPQKLLALERQGPGWGQPEQGADVAALGDVWLEVAVNDAPRHAARELDLLGHRRVLKTHLQETPAAQQVHTSARVSAHRIENKGGTTIRHGD